MSNNKIKTNNVREVSNNLRFEMVKNIDMLYKLDNKTKNQEIHNVVESIISEMNQCIDVLHKIDKAL